MHILRHLPIAIAFALPVAVLAQTTLQPRVKTAVPVQSPVQAGQAQVRVDETAQLRMQIARQQRQIDAMRQQLERTSQALEQLQRKYAGHFHNVQGSAVPISQFAGEVQRNYRNQWVSVGGQGLLHTGAPRNDH